MSDEQKPISTSRNATLRNWRFYLPIYAWVFGLPLLVLFPYWTWRPDAQFRISVHTRALEFKVGRELNGLFNGSRSDLTVEGLDQVTLPGLTAWTGVGSAAGRGRTDVLKCGQIRFRNAVLQNLLLMVGTSIRLDWYDQSPTGVRIVLGYPEALPSEVGTVSLDEKSTVEFSSCQVSNSSKPESGVIIISSDTAGLAKLYRPKGSNLTVSITPNTTERGKRPALPSETALDLLPGSGVTFVQDNKSAIIGSENNLNISNAARKLPIFENQDLEIADLRSKSSMSGMEIQDGIVLRMQGRSGRLKLDDEDVRPSLAEDLRSNTVISTWLTTAILIGTSVLTVANRIKLVKLDDKD